jgi:protocatechuate 3,4-dioxygenase beta subunit
MFRMMKWAAPVVAFGLLLALSATRSTAADESASGDKGTVTGTVVDKDGKPVANCQVRLFHPSGKAANHKKKDNNTGEDQSAVRADHKAQTLAKGNRPTPVASTTTDNDGKFTLNDVPAGNYMVIANQRGVGNAREKVTVKAGETATVELKLSVHEKGAGKAKGKNKPAKSDEQ